MAFRNFPATNKLVRFVKALLLLFRKKSWGPFTEAAEITKFDHAFTVSYSQCGEDVVLQSLMNHITNGKYIDIGAHHPSRFSVTRLLYTNGWSGLNIEANEALIKEFNKTRIRDINIFGAAGMLKNYKLAIFEETALSTTNKNWEDKFLNEGAKLTRFQSVPGIKIYDIVIKYFKEFGPDLLTIDIEGSDHEALLSLELEKLNRKLHPKFVQVETRYPLENVLNEQSIIYLLEHGYKILCILPYTTILGR